MRERENGRIKDDREEQRRGEERRKEWKKERTRRFTVLFIL